MTTGQKELPAGWKWVKLGDVCLKNGLVRGPFGGSLKKEIFVSSGYMVYEQSHAISGNLLEGRYFVTEAKYKEMERFQVQPSDLLMSCSGTIGKIAVVPEEAPQGIINQALLKIRIDPEICRTEYIKYFLESDNFYRVVTGTAVGTAMVNVSSVGTLKSIPIPLPPLEEQKRIAGILNKAEEIKKLREEADKKTEELIPAIFHEMVGSRIKKGEELPDGWKWVKLGDVCHFTGGSSLPDNEDCPEKDRVYLLKVSGLTQNFCDGKYLTRATGYTSRSTLRNRVVESPAIVFPKRGGAIAKNRKVMTSIPTALDPNLMAIDTHGNNGAHLEYLYWWLNSFDLSSIQTGTTVPQINRQDLAPLSIPLPPLEEQKRISDRLNEAEEIKKTNEESNKKIEELQSSLLQRAFRGEL